LNLEPQNPDASAALEPSAPSGAAAAQQAEAIEQVRRTKRFGWRAFAIAGLGLFLVWLEPAHGLLGGIGMACFAVGTLIAGLASFSYVARVYLLAPRFGLGVLLVGMVTLGALLGLVVTAHDVEAVGVGIAMWVIALIAALERDPT